MKFSENWLRTLVNPSMDSKSVMDQLTMSGLEVEAREELKPGFSAVVVARVIEVAQHPSADRLKVCQVDVGLGQTLQIVCGAPNVAVGAVVPCALVGAHVGAIEIKQANLRGVTSSGMLCSAKELGLSVEGTGLLILPNDAPIGGDLAQFLDMNDTLTTLKLTPNRGDCLSLIGLAREISALVDAPITPPRFNDVEVTLEDRREVRIDSGDACGVYCGRVIRLTNPSAVTPTWIKSRLERSGLRPISPIVDVTNYVMIEMGQPLHAFDNDKLSGAIAVRFSTATESLRLLNQQEVMLSADMVVITDATGPVALGGVMGGDATSVTDATTSIFLESAFFPPSAIAGRARRLGVTSDAAYRFERGVDFGITRRVLERATRLIIDIYGGAVGPLSVAQSRLPAREPVLVRPSRVARVLGVEIDTVNISNILVKLGCACQPVELDFLVTPPSHRFDLSIEEDFIEEVARIYGYDNIPALAQRSSAVFLPRTQAELSAIDISHRLVDRDYQEVLTYSFVNAQMLRDFSNVGEPIALRNPFAEQMGVMRTTLLVGLVDTLRFNLNRKQDRVRIFEIGRCFLAQEKSVGDEFANQPMRVGGLCYGNRLEEQWGERARLADYFDVKGDIEAIFRHAKIEFKKTSVDTLHPVRSSAVYSGGFPIGFLGEIHPRLCQKYELSSAPIVFELELLPLLSNSVATYREISKFPNVRRDIAVVVDEEIPAQAMLQSLYSAAPAHVLDIQLFDQFRGGSLAFGKKSLAFRVVMNDTEKTLTEEEIEKIDQKLKNTLVSLHQAQLRS